MATLRGESYPLNADVLPPPDMRLIRGFMIGAIAVAIIIRVGIAGVADGTNDALTWRFIAETISENGLIATYQSYERLNHPPLAALWSQLALQSGAWFTLVMKIPAIAGDALSVALLGMIWLERNDPARARAAMIAMALSPIAIIISGYHCNTDNLYAFFSLLSMYLLGTRRQFFAGGLALGAAINVKLIPVLLIPAAFSFCRSWGDFRRLSAALGLSAIPFLPLLLGAPDAVKSNMLSYVPPVSPWGIAHLIRDIGVHPSYAAAADQMLHTYRLLGQWLILGCVGALCLLHFRRPRWHGLELGTLVFALFLVLAPGFGTQYTTIIVPLLLGVSISRAWTYGVLAGLYSALMFGAYLVVDPSDPDRFRHPFLTLFPQSGPPPPAGEIGLLAWFILVLVMIDLLRGRLKTASS